MIYTLWGKFSKHTFCILLSIFPSLFFSCLAWSSHQGTKCTFPSWSHYALIFSGGWTRGSGLPLPETAAKHFYSSAWWHWDLWFCMSLIAINSYVGIFEVCNYCTVYLTFRSLHHRSLRAMTNTTQGLDAEDRIVVAAPVLTPVLLGQSELCLPQILQVEGQTYQCSCLHCSDCACTLKEPQPPTPRLYLAPQTE